MMEDDIQIRACLTAAKGVGLVRVNGDNQLCPGSELPSVGWYGAEWGGSGSYWRANVSLGGPWSAEFVSRLAACGYLGVDYTPACKAHLTKAGRSRLKVARVPKAEAPSQDAA